MDIKRDKYLNDLIERMHNGMIKVVTGIRRCGKSYLLFNIFKNYINRGRINQFNNDEILFLINKYNIEYDSTPVGLTLDKSEKLYTLKYVFSLLW